MTPPPKRPRRRQRLGLPTRRSTRKEKQANPGTPTDEDFVASKTFKSARVEDAQGDVHEFCIEDDILVVPSGQDPDTAHLVPDTENWVAKIKKIVRSANGEVWVKVEWYWSAQDIASIVKSFEPSSHAAYELFPDVDSQNYIPIESIVDTVKVILYDDCDLEPPLIGPTTFFCRHTFRPKTKRVTPFSLKEICSLCQRPYNPDASKNFPESLTMHFCPRDTCQTAWHSQCLSTHATKKRPTCTDRNLSLMCSIPSDLIHLSTSPSASTSPPSLMSLLSKPKPTPSRSQSKTAKRGRGPETNVLSLLEDLPQGLVELASQPIVKPTLEPRGEPPKKRRGKRIAPEEPENVIENVAGNITTVLKARVLINDVLRGTTILPRDWGKKIGWHDNKPNVTADCGEDSPCPPLLCPTCGEHI